MRMILWMLTGCQLGFFGISAGTASLIGTVGTGALSAGSTLFGGLSSKKANGSMSKGQIQSAQQSALAQGRAAEAAYNKQLEANAKVSPMQKELYQKTADAGLAASNSVADRNMSINNDIYRVQSEYAPQMKAALSEGNQKSYEALSAASTKAAAEQLQGLGLSNEQYQKAYNDIQEKFSPYTEAGRKAIDAQSSLLGLNGSDAYANQMNFLENNQYRELAKQSEDALLQSQNATGGIRGGNTQVALAQLRPAMLQQLIDRQLTNYGLLGSQGLQATGQVSGYRDTLGQRLGQNATQAGNVNADNSMNQGQYSANYALNNAKINYDDLANRLQYYIDSQGQSRDIQNEQVLRNAGINIDNINNQGNVDINQILAEAGIQADKLNNEGRLIAGVWDKASGAQAQNAQSNGDTTANMYRGLGNAAASMFGGLTNNYINQQKPPPANAQGAPSSDNGKYGFAGLQGGTGFFGNSNPLQYNGIGK